MASPEKIYQGGFTRTQLAEMKAKVDASFRASGGVITAEMEAFNDLMESQLGTPAAPGIDPIVAELAKTPKSTQMDDYRAIEDVAANRKHMCARARARASLALSSRKTALANARRSRCLIGPLAARRAHAPGPA